MRNTLQPSNGLPPEILSQIARGVPNGYDMDARAIVPMTHVCQYWRESIVSTPANWTTISGSRRLAAASLERAKAALLEIHLDMHAIRDDPQFLDYLAPHLQNTETLGVTGILTTDDILFFTQHPMTNLRSLSLWDETAGDLELSIDPFESSRYTLRRLDLFGVPLYPSLLNIRTLTRLELLDHECKLHLDILLDFLEENRSLTSVVLRIGFIEPSLRSPRRRTPIRNRLRHLEITCYDAMDGRALLSNIALSKGAELKFTCQDNFDVHGKVNDVLSGISTTHLSNLLSPTVLRYHVKPTVIEQLGPNGAASFVNHCGSDVPFVEFPRLPLTNIRRFDLNTSNWTSIQPPPGPGAFHHLSFFPALETFTVESETNLSYLLSALLSNPPALPSLKTLAFLDCVVTEEFMEELIWFAYDRKKTTSTWLHHVLFVDQDGEFPSAASIHRLERIVTIVDVRVDSKFPADLT